MRELDTALLLSGRTTFSDLGEAIEAADRGEVTCPARDGVRIAAIVPAGQVRRLENETGWVA